MQTISTNTNRQTNLPQVITTAESIEEESTCADSQYHEIFYIKQRIQERIPNDPKKLSPIEFEQALAETMSLSLADSTYKSKAYCHITFYNQKNFNSINILRICDDLWQLETPVFSGDSNCDFCHIAKSDAKRLKDIIKMFFEGDDWYGLANFRFEPRVREYNIRSSGPESGQEHTDTGRKKICISGHE